MLRAAARSASRRRGIGIGPVCEASPANTTEILRAAQAPATMPISVELSSSLAPCSM